MIKCSVVKNEWKIMVINWIVYFNLLIDWVIGLVERRAARKIGRVKADSKIEPQVFL